MYGMEYYRLKCRMTEKELAERSGVSPTWICDLQYSMTMGSQYSMYERIADALGVVVDDLFEEFPCDAVGYGDHARYKPGKADNEYNCIAHYRWENNLSYQELAWLLGLKTKEGARCACRRESARMVYVQKLADYEGISVGTFLFLYREGELF